MGILSFFRYNRRKTKDNKVVVYENISNELKNKLKTELKRDLKKDFNIEFERTTNLENEVINKYGFEGIKLVFECRNSDNYYVLGNFPKDCPWISLNNQNISDFIGANFKPIKNKIPDIIKALKQRCKFIYAEKKTETWDLHYLLDMKLYDDREYYRVYTGGSPNQSPEPNKSLVAFNWVIPNDLKEFYSIHDGFGEICNANFILNSKDIKVMGEMMNPICEEQNVKADGYSFNDLLEFFPDGGGNAQCFIRVNDDNNFTVDWDHEIWEISGKSGFYNFINKRMSEIDEK